MRNIQWGVLFRIIRDYRGTHLIVASLFVAAASSVEVVLSLLTTGGVQIPEWATPFIPIAGLFGYALSSALKEAAKEERLQAVENDAVEAVPGGATAALYRSTDVAQSPTPGVVPGVPDVPPRAPSVPTLPTMPTPAEPPPPRTPEP